MFKNCIGMTLQVLNPTAQRKVIMLPQVLDVSYLETRRLGRCESLR
jgi:hypothetical protein